MFIKNNSERSWKNFKVDGHKLDIEPGDTFELPDSVGFALLKILGAPAWLVETEAPKEKKQKSKVEKNEEKVVEKKSKKRK